MLVPWLLYWCLNLVTNRRVSFLVIPVAVLLVDAHSAIGLVSMFLALVTVVVFLTLWGWTGLRTIALRLGVCAMASLAILAPLFFAELRFAAYYDPATKVVDFSPLSADFASSGSYFIDPRWRWFSSHNPFAVFVQIDYAIWITITIALVGGGALWVRARRRGSRLEITKYVNPAAATLLGLGALTYFLLQLRPFLWVYDALSILKVIDYPYRMSAFLIPILVILVIMAAEAVRRAQGSRRIA